MGPKIKVRVTGCQFASLDQFVPMQPDGLKTLDPEGESRLRKQIMRNGLTFAIAVTNHLSDQDKLAVVDGHQRVFKILKDLSKTHTLPPIPYVTVQANNVAQAEKYILLASSDYGKVVSKNILGFVKKPMMDELGLNIRIPKEPSFKKTAKKVDVNSIVLMFTEAQYAKMQAGLTDQRARARETDEAIVLNALKKFARKIR